MKRIFINFLKYFSILAFVFLIFNSCYNDSGPSAKISVISDPHYFDTDLLIQDGSAFRMYLAQDPKLLKESGAILDSVIASILNEDSGIVLIPGDLTKDGEQSGHLKVAERLRALESAGKKVYVVPGNHDINNPHSFAFNNDVVFPVPTVSAAEFASIYNEFGYGEAISRDANSLSYVVEPVPGLVIIAMDSCKYKENTTYPIVSGAFPANTLKWIKAEIKKAAKAGKTVFGMMHHNLIEHYVGQKLLSSEYIINNNENVFKELADAGMKVVFTGHDHCQDIVSKILQLNKYAFDIETSSLVSYPCAYRYAKLEDNTLTITSRRVTEISYPLPYGSDFQDYAFIFLKESMENLIIYVLISGLISVDGVTIKMEPDQAAIAAPLVTSAFMANYAGDEKPDLPTILTIAGLLADPDPAKQLLGKLLAGLWTDLPPADNSAVIDLNGGLPL